jgi:signal transduction histidine kinase
MALEQDDSVPASAREDLSMIRRNIELETRLIDDLLDLTRIANGKLELHDTLVDVHGILSRAVEICRPNIDAKKQTLELALKRQTFER